METGKTAKWTQGLLLVICVAGLYILYHRRNWQLLGPVVEMLRSWWIAVRVALGM